VTALCSTPRSSNACTAAATLPGCQVVIDAVAAFAWMDMHRIRGGQIVESWHLEDSAGMLQGLSVTPG
jgi:hypothetical protein